MAAAATSTTLLLPRICSFTSIFRRTSADRIAFGHPNGVPATISSKHACRRVRAPQSQRDPDNPDNPALLTQEDLKFLVKLGAGSVVGAAVIKYGSVLFPDITRPNITQALLTIFFPVIVAVFLLIRQSRSE